MIWFRPSFLFCVLFATAVHHGVHANSPMEMLTTALNELTRVISMPLSAVTGWSSSVDEDFGDDTESMTGAEAGTAESVGKVTDSTVSGLIEDAAMAVHEATDVISGAMASVASVAEETETEVEISDHDEETEETDESMEAEEKERVVETDEEETVAEESTTEVPEKREQADPEQPAEAKTVEPFPSFLEPKEGLDSPTSSPEIASTIDTSASAALEDFTETVENAAAANYQEGEKLDQSVQ